MLSITDAAFSRLHDMLEKHPAEISARIICKGDRVRVRCGKRRPGDKVVEHNGRIVLLLDQSVTGRLEGRVLDIREGKNGAKLGLRRG